MQNLDVKPLDSPVGDLKMHILCIFFDWNGRVKGWKEGSQNLNLISYLFWKMDVHSGYEDYKTFV